MPPIRECDCASAEYVSPSTSSGGDGNAIIHRTMAIAVKLEVLLQQVVRALPHTCRYYAVSRGLVPGIYNLWNECPPQVVGVKGAIHKSFATQAQGEEFMHLKRQV